MKPKLLFVPLSPEAMEELCRRAAYERRRPQDEAAILLEHALGLRKDAPAPPPSQPSR